MKNKMQKYISFFTDFGFKRLFGEEPSKELLIDFLNQILQDEQGQIKNLQYLKTEHLGKTAVDRKAIFDIYCENEKGEKFIVELQKASQNFFKERSVFYSTFPIQDQAKVGEWNFELKAVYTIGILDFVFDEDRDKKDVVYKEKYQHNIKLLDVHTNKIFYDKLTFIYLEMPKFTKTEEELETHFDKWLYLLRNLGNLQQRPEKLQERIFERVFQIAEVAAFTPEQRSDYESSLKYYRDLRNVVNSAAQRGYKEALQELESVAASAEQRGYKKALGELESVAASAEQRGYKKALGELESVAASAEQKGYKKGMLEEKKDIAERLKSTGMGLSQIADITGVSLEALQE